MAEVEIFTPTGVLSGLTGDVGLTTDAAHLAADVRVREGKWFPLDGGRAEQRRESQVAPDDVLVLVATHPEIMVHMTWHSVTLELGPYRVTGELATQPGFDPERALVRPGGTFVPLRDARIELVSAARDRRRRSTARVRQSLRRRAGRREPDARPLLPGRHACSRRRRSLTG